MHFDDISDHRANNFDFLRFALASLVLYYHCFPLLYGEAPNRVIWGWGPATSAGTSAVDGFFVISGFLVTGSWVRKPILKEFLLKRALRIYPALLAASAFCAVVVGPLGADDRTAYWHALSVPRLAASALLMGRPDIPPTLLHVPIPNAVNGSFWTLSYEFECYLFVALLGLIGLFKRRAAVLGLFVAVYALYLLQSFHPAAFTAANIDHRFVGNPVKWLRLLSYFLAGMTCYLYRDKIPYARAWFFAAIAIVLLGYFTPFGLESVLPLFGAYALFYIAFSPYVKMQGFAKHGDFSYGVYLYAFPVQQFLIQQFGGRLNPWTLLLAALPISVLLAMMSWKFVESPFLKLKKSAPKTPGTPLHPVSV